MSDLGHDLQDAERQTLAGQHISGSLSLDDEQRVKVLSPAMLVFRRFIRNRLAIVGVVCITIMFLFSFVGGWLMPFGESEVFTEYVDMSKAYCGVTENVDYRYTITDGRSFPMTAQAGFVLAVNKKQSQFETQGLIYSLTEAGADFFLISELEEVANAIGSKDSYSVSMAEGFPKDAGFSSAFEQAILAGGDSFTYGGVTYTVAVSKKRYHAYQSVNLAIASRNIFDYANAGTAVSFDFQYQAELAMNKGGQSLFTADGVTYSIEVADGIARIYRDGDKQEEYAFISRYIIQSEYSDIFLTTDFKDTVKQTIRDNQDSFVFTNESGVEEAFTIIRNNNQWTVKKIAETLVIKAYEYPSAIHRLGTDANGMDILTRLMFGGRISLMIGFIVVFFETLIGVILGGIAGYFGKWLDNLLMRIVDIFNSIPSIPIIIIIGAVMDAMKIDPRVRMVYLMLILGLLGWPGIARLVRGQILSLREQEFMVAAEATGISVYRKIFKHLVPNVIPQLIVIATMSLGSTILTESVLSFLGLGVKFPYASWGNIINAVSNVHVMTNYWFVWIPAGFCILITVLGFNFIGDGLRDAFDPKMKQ